MGEEDRRWFVGIDWASETHHVRISDGRGRKAGERIFAMAARAWPTWPDGSLP